ncbi:MAG: hypothetical protein Q4F99_03035, partial [bacterium]|nr:hypothetical protein [bacterium]
RFDSRSYDPETDTLSVGDVVHSWGGSQVTAFILLNQPAMGGNVRDALLDLEFTTDAYTTIKNPTLATTTLDIESLLVTNEDGTESTLTGDKLTEHLTPAMVATAPIEDGFALSCKSSDVLTYTLQTKASLSEEWVNFDTIAETLLAGINENLDDNSKKTLANNFEKRYTCLRVKESTQIKIPQSPKETQRFYRLIAE